MKTIRAIFRHGALKPLDPVDLLENTPLTLALLNADDLAAEAIAELADKGKSFEFLNDPLEDIYSESDGEAVGPWPSRSTRAKWFSRHFLSPISPVKRCVRPSSSRPNRKDRS